MKTQFIYFAILSVLLISATGCNFFGVRKWQFEVTTPVCTVKGSADVDGYYWSKKSEAPVIKEDMSK